MPALLDRNTLLGGLGTQYQTVNDQASANSLNAQGYQVASYTPIGNDGQGQWLMSRTGPSQGNALSALLDQYIGSYNEGKAANETRYADILKGYQDRETDANALLAGMGDRAKRDTNQRYDQAGSSAAQMAVGRGLTNSSVAANMLRGIEMDRNRALMDIDEGLRRQALDYRTSLSGDRLQFMASRNDQYPTLDNIGQLVMALTGGNNQITQPGAPATTATGGLNFGRLGSG